MNPADPRIDPRRIPAGSKAIVIAENQDEYENLPSVVTPMQQVITCWEPTDEERIKIACGEPIYITILGTPINPLWVDAGQVDWVERERALYTQFLEYQQREAERIAASGQGGTA